MTDAAVRFLHGAPRSARVSKYTYEAGDDIEGTSKETKGYVLAGRVTFSCADGCALLEAGDVVEFSGGDYTLRVGPREAAIVLWAWDLPQKANPPDQGEGHF